jgi:hypothetical protein
VTDLASTAPWLPTRKLIATKHLELRKRRGLMVAVGVLTLGAPVLILGVRLLFHLFDPSSYGPAGDPSLFSPITGLMAEFGFIVAAALGAAAGSTDLTDGFFRQLVITGRSRLALYLARIPAGLAIVVPIIGLGFAVLCLVTSYAGVAPPTSVSVNGVAIPVRFDQTGLRSWADQHPKQAQLALGLGSPRPTPAAAAPPSLASARSAIARGVPSLYGDYTDQETTDTAPTVSEMIKIGLWLELEIGTGFLVGLGLGSLMGQRTMPTLLLIALEIIVTPVLANNAIPYFLDGQRLVVGIALDQLRPAALGGFTGHGLLGGSGALGIPPMPAWAMITVIVGWTVGWSSIGAWRMMTRDA